MKAVMTAHVLVTDGPGRSLQVVDLSEPALHDDERLEEVHAAALAPVGQFVGDLDSWA